MKHSLRLIAIVLALLVISLPVCFAGVVTYDANGNVVYTQDDNLYRTYNSENRLWRVYNGSTSTLSPLLEEYTYDLIEDRVLMKKTYN
jgi:hypothetical protein